LSADDELKIKYDNYNAYINAETDTERMYYNRNIFEHPELLNFWFDFLDTEGEL
jgi:hypothetical protein